jgi:adenylate cyclase
VMGRIRRNHDWDFAGAESEFKRAIELNPNLSEAYGTNAILMMFRRRFDEAIDEVKCALELDPRSGIASQQAGVIFLYSRRYDDAMREYGKALEIDPDNDFVRGNLGLAHVQKGMFEDGLNEIQKVSSIKNPSSQSDLAYAFAKAGRLDELKTLLKELLREADTNVELAVAVASAYANLGDHDNAIAWLEKAFEEHLPYLTSLNADFVFDNIRSDPRFQALMKKVGFTNLE